jgi:phospholipid/cholesterol/gamma-HCH transport system permease protein
METAIGGVVAVAMFRELGPVLAGLMVAGRVGAAMCAEIGTMKVSEQIDALRALGVHPVDYLVTPRMLAMMISMPLLVAESIAFGILASWLVAVPGARHSSGRIISRNTNRTTPVWKTSRFPSSRAFSSD